VCAYCSDSSSRTLYSALLNLSTHSNSHKSVLANGLSSVIHTFALSVKLIVAEAFYFVECYIIGNKLGQRVYMYVTVMSMTVTFVGEGVGAVSVEENRDDLCTNVTTTNDNGGIFPLITHDSTGPFPRPHISFLQG
jgi:hypothetical protein